MKYINSNDFHSKSKELSLSTLKTKKYNGENLEGIKNLDSEYLPKLHLTSTAGLINDPNGLHQDDDGTYYIYYQASPFYPAHFMKHWGLYTTKDFINYEDKGIVLTPGDDLDLDGAYSGASYNDGKESHIFYTGNINNDKTDEGRSATTTYLDKNTGQKNLMFEVDKEHYTGHFRDPAPFTIGEDKYLIHGAQSRSKKGLLSVYKSDNWKTNFQRLGDLEIENLIDSGHMLECPNLININGKDLLLFSVQGSEQFKKDLPIDIVVYGLGNLDIENLKYNNEGLAPLDYGFDFYAPQLFKDNNDRVIMFGWLGNGFNLEYLDANDGYNGALTIPRELNVIDGKLHQKPVAEILNHFNEEVSINEIDSKQLLIDFSEIKDGFKFELKNDQDHNIKMTYENSEFVFDRTKTSKLEERWILKNGNEESNVQRIKINNLNNAQLLIDASTFELFLNDGQKTFTSRVYISGDWKIETENSKIEIKKPK